MTTRHLIDPELLPLLEFPLLSDLDEASLAAARAVEFEYPAMDPAPLPPDVVFVAGPEHAPDVPVRLFVPSGPSPRPAILHIHGGGYVLGTAATSDIPNRLMSDARGALIASVEYRLAPENPFPAPVEDCYAALVWLTANAERLGVDPRRIVVLGESAGGGLAAALALMARDRGGPSLAAQFLIYPMLDHRTGTSDEVQANPHAGEFIWTPKLNRFGWRALRGTTPIPPERMAHFSPALASDLSGLPPSYIATGALDLFLEEDVDYALRLTRAGIATELHVYPGAIHAFDKVPDALVAQSFKTDLARALDRAFGRASQASSSTSQ